MSRLIDKDPETGIKGKPMRLLLLGLSRTGTSSLCVALGKLGYKTYHMSEAMTRPKYFMPRLYEALNAKFDPGCKLKPYGKEEFDKFWPEYDAASDVPVILFAPELLTAYPEAKIILTTRPPDKWVKSIQTSIWRYHSWKSWNLLQFFNPLIYWWQRLDRLDWDVFMNTTWRANGKNVGGTAMEADQSRLSVMPRNPRSAYISADWTKRGSEKVDEWNDYIRNLVSSQGREADMLEFQVGGGWEPLCEFLGVDVPRDERGEKEEYPRVWSGDEMKVVAWQVWGVGVVSAIGAVVVPVGVILGAIYWCQR